MSEKPLLNSFNSPAPAPRAKNASLLFLDAAPPPLLAYSNIGIKNRTYVFPDSGFPIAALWDCSFFLGRWLTSLPRRAFRPLVDWLLAVCGIFFLFQIPPIQCAPNMHSYDRLASSSLSVIGSSPLDGHESTPVERDSKSTQARRLERISSPVQRSTSRLSSFDGI